MIDENKEEDEADHSQNQSQKAKKEAFAGSNAICFGIGSHFAASYAHSIVVFASVSGYAKKWWYGYFLAYVLRHM